jgi:DNA polymerase-3 subunit alpha
MKKLKIKSIKSLGIVDVYDIEMSTNHNFILDNGVVAHNCSYAILSYNTMWMKYHYPLYFWKGILEINSGESKDNFKVLRDLLTECGGLVSEITLDKSHKDQWIVNEKAGKIIPPLSLIKGMGAANVDKVLKSLKDAGIR